MCVCGRATREHERIYARKETHDGQTDDDGGGEQRKVRDKGGAAEEHEQVLERVRGLGDDAKVGDEDGASGDEESAEEHPWGKDVAEEKTSKERVPKERDCAEGGENDDW